MLDEKFSIGERISMRKEAYQDAKASRRTGFQPGEWASMWIDRLPKQELDAIVSLIWGGGR